MNWYTYAANNPLRFVDPDGLEARPYDPDLWNKDEHVLRSTNCYAYALDFKGEVTYGKYEGLKLPFGKKPQPGFLVPPELEYPEEFYRDFPLEEQILLQAFADAVQNEHVFGEASLDTETSENTWLVAFVAGYNEYGMFDYHWYRQDLEGTWSHKRGLTEVTNLDADDKEITDPRTANRNYSERDPYGVNYYLFLGFFEVGYE